MRGTWAHASVAALTTGQQLAAAWGIEFVLVLRIGRSEARACVHIKHRVQQAAEPVRGHTRSHAL